MKNKINNNSFKITPIEQTLLPILVAIYLTSILLHFSIAMSHSSATVDFYNVAGALPQGYFVASMQNRARIIAFRFNRYV